MARGGTLGVCTLRGPHHTRFPAVGAVCPLLHMNYRDPRSMPFLTLESQLAGLRRGSIVPPAPGTVPDPWWSFNKYL